MGEPAVKLEELEDEVAQDEISDVTIDNPDFVDDKIKETKSLKRLINLKYQLNKIETEIKELTDPALAEYRDIFQSAKLVKGAMVSVNLSYGPTSFTYSEVVNKLKTEIADQQKKEKKDGTATTVPSEKMFIKVKFNEEKINGKYTRSWLAHIPAQTQTGITGRAG